MRTAARTHVRCCPGLAKQYAIERKPRAEEICFCPDRHGACRGSLFVPSHANPADARGVIHDDASRQRMRTSRIQGTERRLSLVWDRPLPERVLWAIPRCLALERLPSRLLAGTMGALSRHAVSRPAAGRRLEIGGGFAQGAQVIAISAQATRKGRFCV
jgi:hypothetical protein